MTPALEIKAIDGYVEAEVTKQKEILLRLTDFDDLVVGVLMDDQQVRWLIDYLSKHLRIAPEARAIKRYDINATEMYGEGALDIEEASDGLWVKYEDVAAFLPEVERRVSACMKACEHFDIEWLERNRFDDYALYTKDEHARTVVEMRRMQGALELIAKNHDDHETFSGTRCAEIARASLPQNDAEGKS